MSIAQETTRGYEPYIVGAGPRSKAGLPRFEHAERTLASKRVISAFGFWIFLLSDIIMFSAFFAAYAVLSGETAGGPSGKDLFSITRVAIETACLLLSSFACGVASIGARARNDSMYYGGMTATALLGAAFLFLEINEFSGLIAQGAGPTRSAFLSSFFALVGCHGLHVTLGAIMLTVIWLRVLRGHFTANRHFAFEAVAWYWHFVDVVWLGLFIFVYWL